MHQEISLKILDERIREHMPAYATEDAAGIDLRACIEAPLTLEPNQVHLIATGMSIYMGNPLMAAMIHPRSGLGHKHGLVLGNLTGVIDAGYQGALMVSCWNRSAAAYTIQPLERIAQLVFVPIIRASFKVVDEFPRSARGEGGFGSTGRS